jgi:hypothetical protein
MAPKRQRQTSSTEQVSTGGRERGGSVPTIVTATAPAREPALRIAELNGLGQGREWVSTRIGSEVLLSGPNNRAFAFSRGYGQGPREDGRREEITARVLDLMNVVNGVRVILCSLREETTASGLKEQRLHLQGRFPISSGVQTRSRDLQEIYYFPDGKKYLSPSTSSVPKENTGGIFEGVPATDSLPEQIDFDATVKGFIAQAEKGDFSYPVLVTPASSLETPEVSLSEPVVPSADEEGEKGWLPDPRRSTPPESLGEALVDAISYLGASRPKEEVMAILQALDKKRIAAIAMAALTGYSTPESGELTEFELEIALVAQWCNEKGMLRRGGALSGAPIEFIETMAVIREQYLRGRRQL